MSRWIQKWKVEGSQGAVWIVAKDDQGRYGCSCPLWKFKRVQCHHILKVLLGGGSPYPA